MVCIAVSLRSNPGVEFEPAKQIVLTKRPGVFVLEGLIEATRADPSGADIEVGLAIVFMPVWSHAPSEMASSTAKTRLTRATK
jgi:hypothetical protein